MKLNFILLSFLTYFFCALSFNALMAQERITLEDYDFSFVLPQDAEIIEITESFVEASTPHIHCAIEVFDDGESYIEFTQRLTYELGLVIHSSEYINYLKGFNAMMLEGTIGEGHHIIAYLNDGKRNYLINILWEYEQGNNQALDILKSIQ